jgi:signal transduction histidine kinase
MYSVLQNLLTNSIKFARPGVPPEVHFSARRMRDAWRVSVRDNGIGIPAEYHGVIFGLCERLNPSESYQGTGMGLSIVGKAAERLHAKIGLESEVGKGSLFWVDLPAATA